MNSEYIAEEQTLVERIRQEQQALSALQDELAGVDGELESMAARREQFELLDRVCTSLDRLEEMGAGELFWQGAVAAERRAGHLDAIRAQASDFCGRIGAIEDRRAGVLERVREQEEILDLLGDELYDLRQEEERRRAEWVVEREADPIPFRRIVMPWIRGTDEDREFRKTLAISVAVSLLVAAIVPMIDLPVPERDELVEVPERLAKLIQAEPEPPPARTAPIEEIPEPEPEEPKVVKEEPPEEVPEVVEPVERVAETQTAPKKQEVRSKGILAFRESFAKRASSGPSARLGSAARVGNAGEAAVGRPTRSMVTTQAPGSSGGINLADVSRDVGGGAGGQGIEGVRVSQVASSIGGNGSADRPRAGGRAAGRTDEEIQIVFDRYKASLYRLYNRELRKDPTLRGQLVLRLTIEPDGSVSMCRLQASDMDAPALADQVVARVRGFDFGAKDVATMTIIYPIDFLPATT